MKPTIRASSIQMPTRKSEPNPPKQEEPKPPFLEDAEPNPPKQEEPKPPFLEEAEPETQDEAQPAIETHDLCKQLIELLDPNDKTWVLAVETSSLPGLNRRLEELIGGIEGLTSVEQNPENCVPGNVTKERGVFPRLVFGKNSLERVLLVPPTDKDKDLDYVDHGVQLLIPGGALVAITRAHDPRRTRLRELSAVAEMEFIAIQGQPDRQIIKLTKR